MLYCKVVVQHRFFIQKLQDDIKLFKKHNMNHQQKLFRDANEAAFVIDLSENYQCAHNVEIRGMKDAHWCNILKNRKPELFCTISPNNELNPFSI